MKNTTSTNDLKEKIERLVTAHLAEIREFAVCAVHLAFGATPQKAASRVHVPKVQAKEKRRCRTQAEVADLAARLHDAACAEPGGSMEVLAKKIGATVRELRPSIGLLKRTGRIRSAGQGQRTRYFPAMNGRGMD